MGNLVESYEKRDDGRFFSNTYQYDNNGIWIKYMRKTNLPKFGIFIMIYEREVEY